MNTRDAAQWHKTFIFKVFRRVDGIMGVAGDENEQSRSVAFLLVYAKYMQQNLIIYFQTKLYVSSLPVQHVNTVNTSDDYWSCPSGWTHKLSNQMWGPLLAS